MSWLGFRFGQHRNPSISWHLHRPASIPSSRILFSSADISAHLKRRFSTVADLKDGWSPGQVGRLVVIFGHSGGAVPGTAEPMEGGEGRRGLRREGYTQVSQKSTMETGSTYLVYCIKASGIAPATITIYSRNCHQLLPIRREIIRE